MQFMRNLLEVLTYLHAKGVIHRDLKPENILMTTSDSICSFKIADFGMACYFDIEECTCLGSPGYMAPEMLRGHIYNSKVDIFSAGIIGYVLATGKSAFSGNNLRKTLENNARCQINFSLSEFKKLSHSAVELIKRLLEPDEESRPTAEEALQGGWSRFRKNSDLDATSNTRHEKESVCFSKEVERY
jgi:serine/threonine protein kinase